MLKSHKKCTNIDGCGLIASFGFNKQEGTKFCSKHKEEMKINTNAMLKRTKKYDMMTYI